MIHHHTLLHTRAYWAGNVIKLEDVSEPSEFGRMSTLNLWKGWCVQLAFTHPEWLQEYRWSSRL